ncbi:MAG TPA: lysylphosphatidylglycerol synthase transmembrane domain-containing protein [Acidobacteriota bacterium]|nr:lysylphosphatidylglycerol synthase transmembrane domain-containing protein [Acidobacteriota bacterium]
MKTALITLAKAGITALLFIILFRKVDFYHFGTILRNARPGVLLAAFLVLWVGHYICIYRWRMLMRPLMPVLSLGHLFGIYCIGLFFNLIFPTVVGGDVVKMYYAGKPSRLYAQSFAATFLDRDAGMLAMMVIACLATVIHPVAVPGIPINLIIWASFSLFLLANVIIFTPSLHRLLTRVLHAVHLPRIAAKIDAISNAFQVMGRHGSLLAGSLAISLVNQLLAISVTWVLAVGLRLQIPLLYFLIFVPVITLISMIPISLNGMGLREYAFMSLVGAIGIAPESCIALGLLSSAFIILSSLPGGVVYIFFRNRNDVQQMAVLGTDFS